MKKVYQTIFTVPGGNCFQDSVASIFELPLEKVPHFCGLYDDDHWWGEFSEYCKYYYDIYPLLIQVGQPGFDTRSMPGYHIAMGKHENGSDHAVVYYQGVLVHDPIPGGNGLASVECYGVFITSLRDGVLPCLKCKPNNLLGEA